MWRCVTCACYFVSVLMCFLLVHGKTITWIVCFMCRLFSAMIQVNIIHWCTNNKRTKVSSKMALDWLKVALVDNDFYKKAHLLWLCALWRVCMFGHLLLELWNFTVSMDQNNSLVFTYDILVVFLNTLKKMYF